MAGRAVIFVQSGGFGAAFQATSLGVTAAAMGDELWFVFAFDALRALCSGTFGQPASAQEQLEHQRGLDLKAASPSRMLGEARKLGARVVACDTTVKLCGLDPAQVAGIIDEVKGLASIWRLTENARVLTF